jgi:Domain of unknown function (DUF3459)
MLRYRSIFLSISTHISHIPTFHTELPEYDEQKTVWFQGASGFVDSVVHHRRSKARPLKLQTTAKAIKEDRTGGDDAIRPAFPASPDDLAPYGWSIYRLHQTLIGMRRRHPWLHRARTHALSLSNTQFVYEAFGSDQRITVALNLDDDVLTVRNSKRSWCWPLATAPPSIRGRCLFRAMDGLCFSSPPYRM